jgi:hypothetical protein
MPKYVVSSEGPIHVVEVEDGEIGGGPIIPGRPGHGLPPHLPPRDEWPTLPPREEWPPLPPWFQPGVGLPIPPTVELPWVPVPENPEVDPPEIWPPLPSPPGLPDLSGKTLVLARIYVSRHVNFLRWVVIDHAEAKGKIERALEYLRSKLPAGGIGGRPPVRPGPGGD